jgi:hypothetical protein
MTSIRRMLLAVALVASATAQEQATTLLAACQRATVIVRATVLAATDPAPAWHRLSFRRDAVLKGNLGLTFELLEPAGACCGRSLFTLQPGQSCLLFLVRTGATLHPFGGARGVLADTPELVAAVQDLLAAATDAQRAQRLIAQFAATDPRIVADAAHALATLPALELDAAARATVVAALQTALVRGTTTVAPLVDAAVRLQDPAVLDAVLPVYLTAARDDVAALLRRGLGRATPAVIADRLSLATGTDPARQLRAAELLAELPADAARAALQDLVASSSCPRVKLCASEALLADGIPAARLQPHVPAAVLDLAQRRRTVPNRFRSITPRQP